MSDKTNKTQQTLVYSALQNKQRLLESCSQSADILFNKLEVGGIECYAVWCDGMIDMLRSWEMIFKQLKALEPGRVGGAANLVGLLIEQNDVSIGGAACETLPECIYNIMAGNLLLFIDGSEQAVFFPAQGFNFRAVSESATEENVRSSRESFVEPLRVNISLVRRRLKSNKLVFKFVKIGELAKTEVALAFLSDRVSKKMIMAIENRLKEVDIELVLESGFIEPFMENRRFTLFSGVGHTERPDTLCGKLREGRVAIIVDGTPFAIVMPQLFSDNFETFDDYTNKPYYASIMRVLKYFAFFISILLPGLYVALVNFNPEIVPSQLLYKISQSQTTTPYPLMFEALFIHVVYEIVREAGLRLPKPVGHAVGLIGALVVGDAAVQAGLIGSPMVMVVALTAISSFMIPQLYEPITVLRLVFIFIGGIFGPVGMTLGVCALLINISSINSYGIPYMAPISPYGRRSFRHNVLRSGWRKSTGRHERLKDLPGATLEGKSDEG